MFKRILLQGMLWTVLVASAVGCAGRAAVADAPAVEPELKLERVVMLMRHGVRPPTKAQVVPEGMADRPWPQWSVGYGELTAHGYEAVRLLGAWDRSHWAARGLLPASGCPDEGTVAVAASSKSRTQATARALVEGMVEGCAIAIDFPASSNDDVEFHPLDVGAMPIDPDAALQAVQALAPAGGMTAELRRQSARLTVLAKALGCGQGEPARCPLLQMQPELVRNEGDRPDVGDPFGIASTAAQTFLLEYLEGMPMSDVAWGRLSREQIEDLLEFHSLKFYYEARAPYVAARAASPLARRMLGAMQAGPRLTVLVGHDTNIADLGGFLDLHWQVPSYPRDDPPPGGALGFEVLSDAASGQRYVRAFYRSQTMDQVRELQALDGSNAPAFDYLPIPGCASLCPLQEFERIVSAKLVQPLRAIPQG